MRAVLNICAKHGPYDAYALVGGGCPDCACDRASRPAPSSDREADLRAALIRCGRAAGAFLSDNVSNDFLIRIPGEVEAKIAALAASPGAVAHYGPTVEEIKAGIRRGEEILSCLQTARDYISDAAEGKSYPGTDIRDTARADLARLDAVLAVPPSPPTRIREG